VRAERFSFQLRALLLGDANAANSHVAATPQGA
jgi:hypothetical protein